LALAIGLFLSFLLSQRIKGRALFEAFFITPLAVAPIVVGVVWSPSAVWDDVNTFVHFVLKLPYIDLLSPFVFFPTMILSEAWEWSPLIMLVALSIIASVPKEIFEAASLHGASPAQVFRKIALPTILRSPVMQFVIVLRLIDSMRAFEIPFAWSTWVGYQQAIGSPVDTLSLYLYKLMFVPVYHFPAPFISAVAISLLVITLIGASTLLRLMRVIGKLV
jgi:multiple sugar transport system permease protein